MVGLRALEEGEAQLEVGAGEMNWAGLSPGWLGSCSPGQSPQLGVEWGRVVRGVSGDQMGLKDAPTQAPAGMLISPC